MSCAFLMDTQLIAFEVPKDGFNTCPAAEVDRIRDCCAAEQNGSIKPDTQGWRSRLFVVAFFGC